MDAKILLRILHLCDIIIINGDQLLQDRYCEGLNHPLS